jgi:hypothetical protein
MAIQMPLNLVTATRLGMFSSLLTWLLPFIAVFGLREENWNVICKTVCWQNSIGGLCLLYVMPAIMVEVRQTNPMQERLNLAEAGGGILLSGSQLAYAGTFLLLSFRWLSTVWRLALMFTTGLTIWIALIGQFRSGIASVLIAVFLGLIYIPVRVGIGKLNRRKRVSLATVVLIWVGLFAFSASSTIRNVVTTPFVVGRDYMSAIMLRGVSISDEGFKNSVDDRIEESRVALGEQNLIQLVVGKGFGATWSGGYIYEERRDMLHLGIGHLMLCGGIMLTLFVIMVPALLALRVFIVSHSRNVLICGGVVCVSIAASFISNIFAPGPSYIMLVLCVGGSMLHLQPRVAQLRE